MSLAAGLAGRPGGPMAPPPIPRIDARTLLNALESQSNEALQLAAVAQYKARYCMVGPLMRFRRKVEEFRTAATLLEERLEAMTPDKAAALQNDFVRLERIMLMLLIRTCRTVFDTLLKSGALPLGAREVLHPDLLLLRETRRKLNETEHGPALGQRVREELEAAVAALKTIFERVPELPDFDTPDQSAPRTFPPRPR